MRNSSTEIIIDPDKQTLAQRLEAALQAYKKTLERIEKTFRQPELSDTVADLVRMSRYTEKFSGQLSCLRMNLGRLKAAISDAFAPIGTYVLPLINRAINSLTGFIRTIGGVLAAVMDSVTGTDSAAISADEAADSYESLGTAAKRSLAGFDQIQRLNGSTGSTAPVTSYDPLTHLTGDMQAMASKLLQLLEPLLAIDLTPLRTSFEKLWQVVRPLLSQLGQLLSWLWQAVAVPFIAWCMQTLFPALTDTFSGALSAVSKAADSLITGLKLLWDGMQPVVQFIRDAIVKALQAWQTVFGALAAQLEEKGPAICTIFNGIGQVVRQLWAIIGPILTALYDQFQKTFAGLGTVATQVFGAILEGLAGLTEFVAGAFTADWKRSWNGVLLFFKSLVNSFIGLLNAMLVKLTGSLNAVIRLANSLKFTVPEWVPGIGGEQFGFSFKTVTAPQIPYLAKGAVLPANKPFLAMVGDQRHGTNIEAPLETIQQAVASVMEDYSSANRAGHAATVAVLGDILQAVLGIELGDEMIANAVHRHQTKMAIVRGG